MIELLKQTPSQTVGPYFAYGLTAEQYHYPFTQIATANLIQDETIKGERISITGKVLDGDGNFIPDAMIEIWQADADGNYKNPNFKGFGRVGTGTSTDGSFSFETIMPGSVNEAAPHISMIVFMRGILTHAYTRMYFSDEFELNKKDEVLKSVDPARRNTLVAKRNEVDNKPAYHFDIYMQGEKETVFFDV
jgi:protocatechuate 3,4-dioxygenase, alpha subunit